MVVIGMLYGTHSRKNHWFRIWPPKLIFCYQKLTFWVFSYVWVPFSRKTPKKSIFGSKKLIFGGHIRNQWFFWIFWHITCLNKPKFQDFPNYLAPKSRTEILPGAQTLEKSWNVGLFRYVICQKKQKNRWVRIWPQKTN